VVEAASENLDLKLELFAALSDIVPDHAVLASNTSSISITRLAAATKRPDRVIGMHFFNPVPLMALVELIRGLQTSDEAYALAEAAAKAVGKTPVRVRNSPGFVVNRMLCPMINEAVYALAEGLATAEEIDNAMKLGANHPIGPLALCDLIGLDVELAVMNVLYDGFKDPKYRPAPLLVEMVEAGYLGRKSGRGFFRYD
jgi:3-hydroxybutyryl-CoA dehydrogenase